MKRTVQELIIDLKQNKREYNKLLKKYSKNKSKIVTCLECYNQVGDIKYEYDILYGNTHNKVYDNLWAVLDNATDNILAELNKYVSDNDDSRQLRWLFSDINYCNFRIAQKLSAGEQ